MRLENTDISVWDFSMLRAELQRGLDSFAGLVYTDETIKDAKNDRNTLNKVKKVIDDARKAYKARCLAPYAALEPQIKELVDMVEKQRVLIDETVKDFETRQKEEKELEVRKYYDRKAVVLGNLADALYSKLFDKKWCKILLESRSLTKEEMYPIIDKLLQCCVPYKNYKQVSDLISNEKFHYLEPHHGRKFVDDMWDISSAVYEHRLMRIRYQKLKEPDKVKRLIQPVGIMFSEYYFYLCAYISVSEEIPEVVKHPFPTIYRIDRIAEYEVLDEHFHVPYADRFQEGEFRKRIQFMFGGELRTIKFKYRGLSIESVLDRFPTAEIVEHNDTGWTIKAEVYGDGVDIWLRGQGDIIEVINGGKKHDD